MNKITIFFITSLIAIFLGWGIGSYITYNNTIEQVGKIPASPIITLAQYDKKNHAVLLSILNSGTIPLTVISKSFVFKPGKDSKQKSYEMANIPANIVLPPLAVTIVALDLKKGSNPLEAGDIVMSTIHYTHSLSKDVYTVSHKFEYTGKEKESK